MCADKNACGCHLPKHGIENRPVASALNRIKPYEDPVNLHELFTNFRAKIVVINRRLGMYPFGGKRSEQVCEPVILSCCVPPYLIIARVKNRDPSVAILCHRVSLSHELDVVSQLRLSFYSSCVPRPVLMKPMSVKLSASRRKIRLAFMLPWRLQSTSGPDTKTHRERLLHSRK